MNINEALRKISKLKGELAVWTVRFKQSIIETELWNFDKTIKKSASKSAWSSDECMTRLRAIKTELFDLESAVANANAYNYIDIYYDKNNKFLNDNCQESVGYMHITVAGALKLLQQIKSDIALYKTLVTQVDYTQEEVKNGYYDTDSNSNKHDIFITKCTFTERDIDNIVIKLQDDFDLINSKIEKNNSNDLQE